MHSPKCAHCGLYNFAGATTCKRCLQPILYQPPAPPQSVSVEMNRIKCPRCGLYDFAGITECRRCKQRILYQPAAVQPDTQNQIKNTVSSEESRRMEMLGGGLLFLFGVVVTGGSYLLASKVFKGGVYVIAWGAIASGALKYLNGMARSK